MALLQETLTAKARERYDWDERMNELNTRISDRTPDPYTAVEEVLTKLGLWEPARACATLKSIL